MGKLVRELYRSGLRTAPPRMAARAQYTTALAPAAPLRSAACQRPAPRPGRLRSEARLHTARAHARGQARRRLPQMRAARSAAAPPERGRARSTGRQLPRRAPGLPLHAPPLGMRAGGRTGWVARQRTGPRHVWS